MRHGADGGAEASEASSSRGRGSIQVSSARRALATRVQHRQHPLALPLRPNASRQGHFCSHAQALHTPTSLIANACPLSTAPIGLRSQEKTRFNQVHVLALPISDAAGQPSRLLAAGARRVSSAPPTGAFRARISRSSIAPSPCVCSSVARFHPVTRRQPHRSSHRDRLSSRAACVWTLVPTLAVLNACGLTCAAVAIVKPTPRGSEHSHSR